MVKSNKLVTDIPLIFSDIADGSTICTSGFVSAGVPNFLLTLFEDFYASHGHPKDLTLVFAAGQGDGKSEGLNHLGRKGCLRRVVGGHYGLCPQIGKLVFSGDINAYCLPQGVISNSYRALARSEPFVLSRTGLHTFVDPRIDGGKINGHDGEDLVHLIKIDDEEYLKYHIPRIDVALLRGTVADVNGNVSPCEDCVNADVLVIAQAAKANGGKVIVEVKRIVDHLYNDEGILPINVHIPGILVDHLVLIPEEHQFHTFKTKFNPAFIGMPSNSSEDSGVQYHPSLLRGLVGARGSREIQNLGLNNPVVNIGIGMPEDVAFYCEHHGVDLYNTVEVGPAGGIPQSAQDFGCMVNPQVIMAQHQKFDMYHSGTFLDAAVLGLAECDQFGNLNVSKFGCKLSGCGGFIDISQNCPKIVFVGTFTASGLAVSLKDGKLVIEKEGKFKKFVKNVQHVTFSSVDATNKKQSVKYITERATFELVDGVFMLTSVAPGVDIQTHVLDQMEFEPKMPDGGVMVDESYFDLLDLKYFE
ncbi:hypothetical protein GEMRC1_004921 [Eukaryota sp. GEM-RC1]